MWEQRRDRNELGRATEGPGGSLVLEGICAVEGVMVYQNSDGSVQREFVSAATLAASAPSLARATLCLHHPGEPINPGNYSSFTIGDVPEAKADGDRLRVKIVVRREDAIAAVQSGEVVQLSPSYVCDLGPGGHHPVHGRYDREQKARKYDHLALVSQARGGPDCRVRVDAADPPTAFVEPRLSANERAKQRRDAARKTPLTPVQRARAKRAAERDRVRREGFRLTSTQLAQERADARADAADARGETGERLSPLARAQAKRNKR